MSRALEVRDALAPARAAVARALDAADRTSISALGAACLAATAPFIDSGAARRAWGAYRDLLHEHGEAPLPVTRDKLAGCLVKRRERGISMERGHAWCQQVIAYARELYGEAEVAEAPVGRRDVHLMATTMPAPGRPPKTALTLGMLHAARAATQAMRPRDDDWFLYLMLAVGWHAGVRTSIAVQLRTGDVQLVHPASGGPLQLKVSRFLDKTDKVSGKLRDTKVDVVTSTGLEPRLRAWERYRGIRLGVGSEYLFPIPRGRRGAGQPYQSETFVNRAREVLARTTELKHFDGSSLRYGGSQHLVLSGVPQPAVAAIIGWAQPAVPAQRYHRDVTLLASAASRSRPTTS